MQTTLLILVSLALVGIGAYSAYCLIDAFTQLFAIVFCFIIEDEDREDKHNGKKHT